MKYIIAVVFILILSGCQMETDFKFRGHDYISFSNYPPYGCGDGIVHDPDCSCFGNLSESSDEVIRR